MEVIAFKNKARMFVFRIILYATFIYFIAEFIKWTSEYDIVGRKFNESSPVKFAQSILLIATSLLSLYCFFCYYLQRTIAYFLFAFTLASFIREQDAYFDKYLFDGAWQTVVYVILVSAAYLIVKRFSSFAKDLSRFSGTFSSGMILAGVLSTYVFARLFGRQVFWRSLMGAAYSRDVKNVAEQGLELFGYALMFIGVIEFFIYTKNNYHTKNLIINNNYEGLERSEIISLTKMIAKN